MWPSTALIREAAKALGLHHSSSCGQSEFVNPRRPCDCGAEREARRIVLAVGPLVAEQCGAGHGPK